MTNPHQQTILQERHLPRFAGLTPPMIHRVVARVAHRWPDALPPGTPTPETGGALFDLCRGAGLDHARVVLALAGDPDDLGRAIVEQLVGREIVPWAASVEAAQSAAAAGHRGHGAPLRATSRRIDAYATRRKADTRTVLSVADECPHKAGTRAAASWQYWVVGRTVQECRDAGDMHPVDVRRDIFNGDVKVGPPRDDAPVLRQTFKGRTREDRVREPMR